VKEVRRGDGEESEAGDVLAEFLPGGESFGHDRAHRDDRGFGVRPRLSQPIAAVERALAPAVVGTFDLSDAAG
jgi:hypothetical protein